MKNKGLKRYAILVIMMLSLATFVHTYATSVTFETNFNNSVSRLVNIQKQLAYIAQGGYINILTKQSNKDLINALNIYLSQIKEEEAYIEKISRNQLTKKDQARLTTLQAIARYLEYIDLNLVDYLQTIEPVEQYGFLNNHMQANALLTQLFTYLKE